MDDTPQQPRSGGLDLTRRHRPALFLTGHSLYLALVFVFPFLLTYVIRSRGEFARLVVYINWLALLIDGATLGLGRALQQLAIQTPEEDLRERLRRPLQGALLVLGAILSVLTAAFALAGAAAPGWFEGRRAIAFWLWLAAALGLTRLCFSFLLYGIRQYHWYIGIDLGWAAARLAAIPIGWRVGGIEGALAANALLYAVMLGVSIRVVAAAGVAPEWGPWRRAWDEIRYFLKLGFWMHVTWLAPALARPAAVVLLAILLGRDHADIGLAHLSISVLTVSALLLESLFMSLYPEKARAGIEGRRGELAAWANEEARALGYLLWPPAVAAAGLAWLPVRLLPPEYHDLAVWLAPVALALPARAMAAPLLTALQAGHRPGTGAVFQLLRLALDLAGIALALAYWRAVPAAPAWGIMGGEWVATAVLLILQTRRRRPAGWDAVIGLGLNVFWVLLLAYALAANILVMKTSALLWSLWFTVSFFWYLLLPLSGVGSWGAIRRTFTPGRE